MIVALLAASLTLVVQEIRGPLPALVNAEATLEAVNLEGTDTRRTPIRISGDSATIVKVDLPVGLWRIRVAGNNHWSVSDVADVTEKGAEATLTVFRLAPLSFSIRGPMPENAQFVVQFRGSEAQPATVRVPEASTGCKLEKGLCSTMAPVGTLDVRLASEGFVPEYLWSLPPNSDKPTVVTMERGASVSGFVKLPPDRKDEPAVVEALTPGGQRLVSPPPAGGPASRPAIGVMSARTRPGGFFQIRALPPGEYTVTATHPGGSGTVAASVSANQERRLEEILIEPPLSLPVSIEPPTPPDGGEWVVRAVRMSPMRARLFDVRMGNSGSATLTPLSKGVYSLEIWKGSERWANEAIEIVEPPAPLVIRMRPIQIRGRVLSGEGPVAGSVTFGGQSGPFNVAMAADESGAFEGLVPFAGLWRVSFESSDSLIRKSFREVRVDPDSSGYAAVELRIPDSTLRISVQDAGNRNVEALITVTPQTSDDDRSQYPTDRDGLLELRGLAPGKFWAKASTRLGETSDPVAFEVKPESETEVLLVTKRPQTIKGRLVGEDGVGIPGASLLAFPVGALDGSATYVSNTHGEITFEQGPGIRAVNALFWADGRALHTNRVPLKESITLVVSTGFGDLLLDFGKETVILSRSATTFPIIWSPANGAQAGVASLLVASVKRRLLSPPLKSTTRESKVPGMAPGEYALCMQTAVGLAMGTPPVTCSAVGVLQARGQLQLTLAPPATRAQP
jgi:hypothetical protein